MRNNPNAGTTLFGTREIVKRERALLRASKAVPLGLVIAAAGIVIQIASGVDYPTIPPGLLILIIPAALVFWGRWPWTLIVAVLAALFIVIGYFPSGAAARLLDVTDVGAFLGLWLQFAAGIVTVIAGFIATVQTYRLHSGLKRRM
jgi:hypothetical protein